MEAVRSFAAQDPRHHGSCNLTGNAITALRSNLTAKVPQLFCPSSSGAEKPGGVHGYDRNSGSLCPRPADSSCSVRVHRWFGQLFWRGSLVLPWPYYGTFSNVTTCAFFFLDLLLYRNMIKSGIFHHFFLLLWQVGQLRKLTRDTGVALILLITAKL